MMIDIEHTDRVDTIIINDEAIELDYNCIDLVNFYNSVGLKTKFCCEGHKNSNVSGVCKFYIMFDVCVKDKHIKEFLFKYKDLHNKASFCSINYYKWFRLHKNKLLSNWVFHVHYDYKHKVDVLKKINKMAKTLTKINKYGY